jgi:hypothetical protein
MDDVDLRALEVGVSIDHRLEVLRVRPPALDEDEMRWRLEPGAVVAAQEGVEHDERRASQLRFSVPPATGEAVHDGDLVVGEPERRHPDVHVPTQQLVLRPMMRVVHRQLLGRQKHRL